MAPEIQHITPVRAAIRAVEEALRALPQAVIGDNPAWPMRHSWAPGMYMRELCVPAGNLAVGKIHKHAHPTFLMAGEALVFTESEGWQHIQAPYVTIAAPGTKRIVYSISHTWWACVHHNPDNLTDMEQIEELVIAKDYTALEHYLEDTSWYGPLLAQQS